MVEDLVVNMHIGADPPPDMDQSIINCPEMRRPPLLGRVQEVSRLQYLLEAGRGAIIAGPDGAGKTRILSEGIQIARKMGMRRLHIDADGIAWPENELDVRSTDTSLGSLGAATWPRNAFVALDDAHLLDECTANLVLRLVRRDKIVALLAVSEQSTSASVRTLWKDELLARVDLSPLSHLQMSIVCERMLQRPVEPMAVARLTLLSQNNLIVLRELLSWAVHNGTLKSRGGVWVDSGGQLTPPSLGSGLFPAIAAVDRQVLNALELISFGRSLDLKLARELTSAEVLESLEEAQLISICRTTNGAAVSAKTPLLGEFVRTQTPHLRRMKLLRHLRDGHTRNSRLLIDHVRVAHWSTMLGDKIPATQLVTAARVAWWKNDWRSTIDLAAQAWKRFGVQNAGVLLGRVLLLDGQPTEAQQVLADVVRRHGSEAKSLADKIYDDNRILCEPTTTSVAAAPGQQGTLDRALDLLLHQGRSGLALRAVQSLLDHPDPRVRISAGLVALPALLEAGRPIDCAILSVQLEDMLSQLSTEDVLRYDVLGIPLLGAYARGITGNAEGAADELCVLLRNAAENGNAVVAARTSTIWARLLFDRGQVQESQRLFSAAAAVPDWPVWNALALAGSVLTALHLGDISVAETGLQRLTQEGGTSLDCAMARAWNYASNGRIEEAHRILADAARIASRSEAYGRLVDIAHLLARMGSFIEGASLLGGWTHNLQGSIDQIRAAYVSAAATDDVEGLTRAAEEFEMAGTPLFAAEAFADLARLYRRLRQPQHAKQATARVAGSLTRYDGIRTIGLRASIREPQITERQLKIARLASTGHSSREIASMLAVSVRTIDNQLRIVYQRLGVNRRHDLRAVLPSE